MNPNRILSVSKPPIVAIVGAGSICWGRQTAVDLLLHPDFAEAEIRLLDISRERLDIVHEWVEFASRRLGKKCRISSHTDLAVGLKDATACVTAISVGGDRLWRYDSMHPQLDGIFQPVGDTTGPGGAMRALRHAPPLRNIAETLAAVGAPDALLLQVTNPLNPLTSTIDDIPGIRVLGFCHGYFDTEITIAIALELIPDRPHTPEWLHDWRKECPEVRVELAGNNHFVFVDKLQIGNRIYRQTELAELTPQIFDGPFREAVWSRYGGLVGNNQRHPIEFLPDFLTERWDWGRKWSSNTMAGEIHPERKASRENQVLPELQSALMRARGDFETTASWRISASHEPVADILAAFHTGQNLNVHLNVRNQGAIDGVPDSAHVELYCRIEGGQLHRPAVRFPEKITSEIRRVAASQEFLAQCCRSYDEDTLVKAMMLDALMPKDPQIIRRLMREMIAFQRDWIFPN